MAHTPRGSEFLTVAGSFFGPRVDRLAPRDRQGEIDFLKTADFFFHGALYSESARQFRAQIVNHKRNSIWRFSDAAATRFLGRLGGQASGPISCCCNDMLSEDCHLEGAPRVPKSGEKWRFSSQIRAFVHSSDRAVLGLAWCSRATVCCEPSAFPSSFILPPSSLIQAMEPTVCGMFREPDPSRSGGRGSPGPAARSRCAMMAALERGLWPGVDGCLGDTEDLRSVLNLLRSLLFSQSLRSHCLGAGWGERSSIRLIDGIVGRFDTFKRLRQPPHAPRRRDRSQPARPVC